MHTIGHAHAVLTMMDLIGAKPLVEECEAHDMRSQFCGAAYFTYRTNAFFMDNIPSLRTYSISFHFGYM